jgi:opacity protein-like surface antigen
MQKRFLTVMIMLVAFSALNNGALAAETDWDNNFSSPESLMMSGAPDIETNKFLPGFYLGAQFGLSNDGWDNLKDFYATDYNIKFSGGYGISGRLFAGYDYTKVFGLEFGYAYFGKMSKVTQLDTPSIILDQSRTSLVDLLIKLTWPIRNKFNFYTKTGFGFSHTTGSVYYPTSLNHVNLAYGLGVNYNINSNLVVDLGWLHFDGNQRLASDSLNTQKFLRYQPNTDFLALGVAYKFTDPASVDERDEVDDSEVYEDPFLSGIYLGFGCGFLDTGWRSFNSFALSSPYWATTSGSTGAGVRVFAGYDFSRYWALELGFTSVTTNATITGINLTDATNYRVANIHTQIIDLIGKLKWPVAEGLAFYAKAGVDYLLSTGLQNADSIDHAVFSKDKLKHFAPVYGLGVSYDVTQHFNIDISGARILGNQSLARNAATDTQPAQFTRYQPDVTFVTLGFAYKI